VYIPANQVPSIYVPPGAEDEARGDIGYNTGINFRDIALPEDPEVMRAAIATIKGQLVAYDPVAGEVRWTVDYPTPWNGGLLTTAGNLVFQGTMTGEFKAYNATTGEELWSMDTQSGVLAGASTFMVDGVQHIAFTTGRGGAFAITAGSGDITARQVPNVPRLIVLRIGASGVLPAAPDADAIALEPPESTGTEQQIALGRQLYTRYCMVCHGDAAVGGGVNPDLRFSGYLTNEDAFNQAVLEGALTENGMPDFSSVLNTARANAIRHYVIHKANWDLEQMRARREEEDESESESES
ncbi:MAG: PQQ-binding-like beta-propeller repeat protein, partial [Sphingomonadaceae bacterium]|nr:PQQ-binding-like beta-propeller repeat protein [Sphingomonadaceae bacterium]